MMLKIHEKIMQANFAKRHSIVPDVGLCFAKAVKVAVQTVRQMTNFVIHVEKNCMNSVKLKFHYPDLYAC